MGESTPLPLRIFEICTWVFLFLVLPVGAMGYFAETSNPGDALYPIKRDIEHMVLTLESWNNSALAFYQIELAGVRFKEANKAALASNNAQALTNFTQQISVAEQAVNALPEGSTKTQAKAQLLASISDYQHQLSQYGTNTSIVNLGAITPTITQHTGSTTTTNNSQSTNNSTDTSTSNTTSDTNSSNNTSNQTSNNFFQYTQIQDTPTDVPPATPTPTPSSLSHASSSDSVPTATPVPVPTNTPVPDNANSTSDSGDQTQAVQNVQEQLEITKLKLLPAVHLPFPNNFSKTGGVVYYGTYTWCYMSLSYTQAINTPGGSTCESGTVDSHGNMTIITAENNFCFNERYPVWQSTQMEGEHLYYPGQNSLGMFNCVMTSSRDVACSQPSSHNGMYYAAPVFEYCPAVAGYGSVCSNSSCTQPSHTNEH